MIQNRPRQRSFGDDFIAGWIAERPEHLWELWMRHADQALDDERLLEILQTAWNEH